MSKHVLSIDEIDEQFELIAIHSSSQLHSLAFNINRALGLRLSRAKQDLSFGDKNEKYMVYKNGEKRDGITFFLYQNVFFNLKKMSSPNLLFDANPTRHLLIPELKSVDYVVKYIGEKNIKSLIKSISLLNDVSSSYKVDKKKIKSIDNLIVD